VATTQSPARARVQQQLRSDLLSSATRLEVRSSGRARSGAGPSAADS
jgi:hypothetical protein